MKAAKGKVNITLLKSKGSEALGYPIFISYSYFGKRLYRSLGEFISAKQWDSKTHQVKRTHPNWSQLNKRIKVEHDLVWNAWNDLLAEKKEPTVAAMTKRLGNPTASQESFLDHFTEFIRARDSHVSHHTITVYSSTRMRLEHFEKVTGYVLDYDNIDQHFYEEFVTHLRKDLDLRDNTIGKYVKTVKRFMKWAKGRKYHKTDDYRDFTVLSEETDQIYLNHEELHQINSLTLTGATEEIRDQFLMAAYTGLRFGDWEQIKHENITDGLLELKPEKGKSKRVKIPLHSVVKVILQKYKGQLPRIYENQSVNRSLKEIAKMAGINQVVMIEERRGANTEKKRMKKYNLVRTHTARRSFATNAYLDGIPTLAIMEITGHRKESTFLRYIRVTPDEHARVIEKHWQQQATALKAV
ncbi:MAG: phage integrase SAM-like domain-containing protein [Sphingobacteriales bacterium]|jgi:site-specific recombinase XerD